MASSNVLDMCRLCGMDTLGILRHNIYDDEGLLKKFAEKISNCLPVHVSLEDRLPKIMCGECTYKLDLLSDFRERSVKTEGLLLSLINNIKPEILDEDDRAEVSSDEAENLNSRISKRKSSRQAAKKRYFVESESDDEGPHQDDDDFHLEDDYRGEEEEDLVPEEPVKKKSRKPQTAVAVKRKNTPVSEKKEIIEENGDKSEECSFCGLQVPDLVAHNRELHAHRLICPKCPQVYDSEKALNKHMQELHSSNTSLNNQKCPFQCTRCPKQFTSRSSLNAHCKRVHGGKRKEMSLLCKYCGRAFSRKQYLVDHERKHTNERPFKCTTCEKGFYSKVLLKSHLRVHTVSDYNFECDLCHMQFTTQTGCRAHRKRHFEENRRFPCLACGERFFKRATLEAHQVSKHTHIKPFECAICAKRFPCKYDLQKHIETHLKIKSQVCEFCGAAYFRSDHLRRHKMLQHKELVPSFRVKEEISNGGLVEPPENIVCMVEPDSQSNAVMDTSNLPQSSQVSKGKFKCKICQKTFSFQCNLEKHESRIHNVFCGQCSLFFASERDQKKHRCLYNLQDFVKKVESKRKKTKLQKDEIFECDKCQKIYSFPLNLKKHMDLPHTHLCKVCNRFFVSKRELLKHKCQPTAKPATDTAGAEKESPASKKQKFECEKCKKGFVYVHNFIDHLSKPHVHFCKTCKRYFASIRDRSGHNCNFKCPQCNFGARTRTKLQTHIERFHEGGEPFECDDCKEKFMLKHSLVSHILARGFNHSYQGTYCNICNYDFQSAWGLKQHNLRVHQGVFVCTACSKIFQTKEERRNHFKENHSQKKEECQCPECPKVLSSKHNLQAHIDVVHRKLRPHLCQICGKSYPSKASLKFHMTMHTGEKKHVCEVCQHAFARIENLKQHMRIHNNVKPYLCDFCPQRFRQAGSLNIHRRTHTGETPYQCHLCPQKFIASGLLKNHLKYHPAN